MIKSVADVIVNHAEVVSNSRSSHTNKVIFDVSEGLVPEVGEADGVATGGEASSVQVTTSYWIRLTRKKGFRRMHRRGGCGCTSEFFEEVADITEAIYNSRCGHCWRGADQPREKVLSKQAADDTDSSVETDSESSSTSGAD